MTRNRPVCPARRGVTRHDEKAAFPGYTLYWGRREGRAVLIDMGGEIVHEWASGGDTIWHHADMLPNGNLLALISTNSRPSSRSSKGIGKTTGRTSTPSNRCGKPRWEDGIRVSRRATSSSAPVICTRSS